jgi:hypothetical protein
VRDGDKIRDELSNDGLVFWFLCMMGTKGQGNQRCCLGMLRSLNAASLGSSALAKRSIYGSGQP